MGVFTRSWILFAWLWILTGLHACGGGGNKDEDSGNSASATTTKTYQLTIENIELQDSSENPIEVSGLPLQGQTVTVE